MNKTLEADLSDNEIFPIVDMQGNVIGKATRKQCHTGSRLLHPVVHLHILNERGKLYLQKRSSHKFIQPGKWDTAVGGHVDYGESIGQALRRETLEELGFKPTHSTLLFTYVYDSKAERELVNAFYTTTGKEVFNYDPGEIDDGRYWSILEIKETLGKGIFTPNFEEEFRKLESKLKLE